MSHEKIVIQEPEEPDDKFVELSRKQYPLETRVRWSRVLGLSRDYNNERALELLDDMKNLIKKNNGVKKNEIEEVNNVECKITDVYDILSDKKEIKKDININKIGTKEQDGAIAILIILYLDTNKLEAETENDKNDKNDNRRYIYQYYERGILSDEDVNQLNQLRGIIDANLAVLSNTFVLSRICEEIETRYLRNMDRKQDRIMEEYLCNISCILNKPTKLLKDKTSKTFGQALYYHMLYSEEIKARKKMEPTYSHVSFTARFANRNGIDISAHPRENSGAYVKVDVKHKKISLPRLDLQYFCRVMNFLSLALEHTNFVNQHHVENLLTIYDNLIENGEDVEILRNYDVLRHSFPSDDDCAEFINSATRNIEHHLHNELVDELDKLIKKAKSPLNQSIVFFKKTNMRNHIVIISFLGFTLLWITSLVTAIMQTAKAYNP